MKYFHVTISKGHIELTNFVKEVPILKLFYHVIALINLSYVANIFFIILLLNIAVHITNSKSKNVLS